MPVAIKPLTPLALVNTIATLHPSQHFPVGWIGSLTNHPTSGEHKASMESSSSAKVSSSLGARHGWAGWSVVATSHKVRAQTGSGLIAPPGFVGCPQHPPTPGRRIAGAH